jgi:hypothetical protein
MKKVTTAMFLAITVITNAQQFLNTGFSGYPNPVSNECNPLPGNGWSFGGLNGVSGPQLTKHQNGNDYYIDLTPCNSAGNNSLIYQTINFPQNTEATISFDLRPLKVYNGNHDAGVNVLMDGVLIGTLSNSTMGKWVKVTTPLINISAGARKFTFVGNANITNADIIGIDNITLNISSGCCPGKNLICNGDFEGAVPCFESVYKAASGGLKPGTYSITDYKAATDFCKQWNFNNSPCAKTGKALFVNGVTNSQGSRIIWKQKINFDAWKQYRFCADIMPLANCCFNVPPKINITLTYNSGGQAKTIDLRKNTQGDCGWIKYSTGIAEWQGADNNIAAITVSLDESGVGDGNDFVIDNIFLTELQPIDKAITNNVTVAPSGNGNITGTFSGTLPAGTGFSWSIVTLDANGQPDTNCPEVANPQTWWTATTNFPGFDGCKLNGNQPGKLLPGKTYKIVFGTFGPCNAWDAVVFTVQVDPATGKIKLLKKEDIPLKDPVFKRGSKFTFGGDIRKENQGKD